MPVHGRDALGTSAHVAAFGVIPGGFVVGLGGGIESRIEPVLGKLEAVFDDEGGVGEIHQIIFGDAVVLDGVMDQPAEEGDIRAGANLEVKVGHRGRPREARIDHDHLGVAVALGFNRPLEAARMVFGWIPALDQHHVGVLDVDPAVGHRPAPEGRSQT